MPEPSRGSVVLRRGVAVMLNDSRNPHPAVEFMPSQRFSVDGETERNAAFRARGSQAAERWRPAPFSNGRFAFATKAPFAARWLASALRPRASMGLSDQVLPCSRPEILSLSLAEASAGSGDATIRTSLLNDFARGASNSMHVGGSQDSKFEPCSGTGGSAITYED